MSDERRMRGYRVSSAEVPMWTAQLSPEAVRNMERLLADADGLIASVLLDDKERGYRSPWTEQAEAWRRLAADPQESTP